METLTPTEEPEEAPESARTAMIEAENLTKVYSEIIAVDAISFTAYRGEILGFLGPNGAGKTTTMRILTGFMPPTSGTARVAGLDVFEDSLEMRAHIGYLPESVPLYRDMSVRGYLNFMAELRGVPNRRARVDEVLDLVDMTGRAESLIRNISKGMRQRVGIAQALVHEPEVLILDEPTIGLDPRQVLDVRRLVRNLGRDRTVLFSTHILSEAEQVCDRVLIIDRGRIIHAGTAEELRVSLQEGGRLFVRLGGADSARSKLESVPGVLSAESFGDGYAVSVDTDAPGIQTRIAEAVLGAGWELLELRPFAMTLEDIFLEITAQEAGGEESEQDEGLEAESDV
jgi:ABC-2 type transport system ATP-binding protein